MSENNSSSNTSSKNGQWQRFLYMVLFGILLYIAGTTFFVLVVLQFVFSLVSGEDNRELRRLGKSVGIFFHSALDYLSYNSEDKPFPFAPWPSADETDVEVAPQTESKQTDTTNSDNDTKPQEEAEDAVIILQDQSQQPDADKA